MRLYKTVFIDDAAEPGRTDQATWDGTQSDAAKSRKAQKAAGMRAIETIETDVPTDKAGLLEFLNKWAVVR